MYFDNFSSLLHMDGHGLYVWSTYAIGLLLIAYNVIAPLMTRKRVVLHVKRQQRQKIQHQHHHRNQQQGRVQ